MGHDSFINLTHWKNSRELLEILSAIYIVAREDDETLNQEKKIEYQMISPRLKMFFLGNHEFEHINSTNIREKAR